jgi:hypothetical protein
MSSRKLGCIVLTYEALAKALHLDSEDAVVSTVPPDSGDLANQTVRIIVSGPSMPEHYEGASVAIVSRSFRSSH